MVLAVGLFITVWSLTMDISVEATNGMRVANLSLMGERQNFMTAGVGLSILGLLLGLFGPAAPAKAASQSPPRPKRELTPEEEEAARKRSRTAGFAANRLAGYFCILLATGLACAGFAQGDGVLYVLAGAAGLLAIFLVMLSEQIRKKA